MELPTLLTILQGPLPIPPPFEIPAPGSTPIDVSSIWDYENLYNMVRAFRTAIAFANQNLILQIFVGLGVLGMALHWVLTGGMDRPSPDVDGLGEAEPTDRERWEEQVDLARETYKKMDWEW